MRCDAAWFGNHHAPLHLVTANAAQQQTYIVPCHALIQQLVEHLHTRHHRGQALLLQTDDLHRVARVDHAALNAPRHHRTASLDREHVLNWHHERLVRLAFRQRHIFVHCFHQLMDALVLRRIHVCRGALQCVQRTPMDNRNVIPGEPVACQHLAQLQLHQLQQLRVVHHVDLVQKDHNARHFHLARQQHVLFRLRHGAVWRCHHQDRAIYLRRTCDHVLDVVAVAGHVHVRIMTLGGFVFHVRNVDGDTAGFLFRRVVDGIECAVVRHTANGGVFGDSSSERGLAMVNVTHGAHVHVRLRSIVSFLCHIFSPKAFVIITLDGLSPQWDLNP